jgi:hypothetical protein
MVEAGWPSTIVLAAPPEQPTSELENLGRNTMRKPRATIAFLASLSFLGACACANDSLSVYQPVEPKPGSKEAEIETLQKATEMAYGVVAWESWRISDIQRDAKGVTWLAAGRSTNLHCTADPDGDNAFCE